MTEQQRLGLIVIYANRQQFAGVKSADCFINQVWDINAKQRSKYETN